MNRFLFWAFALLVCTSCASTKNGTEAKLPPPKEISSAPQPVKIDHLLKNPADGDPKGTVEETIEMTSVCMHHQTQTGNVTISIKEEIPKPSQN